MKKEIIAALFVLCCMPLTLWADVDASTSLTKYYLRADGQSGNDLRLALQDVIKGHKTIPYKQLGTLMQWSDTENANGKDVIDIYTDCTFTVSGPITWKSSGEVGAGMNREHTVPQSWFNEQSPMVSDAFHIYPTDCKANNNRSSYLYGEFEGPGTSYSSKKCNETGKLGNSDWTAGTTSYTYNGQTYVATTSYSKRVYEPDDEYKGDLARGYFYMATRYAGQCENWSGGAFGSASNGLGAYTAELMLKWHRLDPVSEKELIRNESIYGNTRYNKSTLKQGNRNPFIDYPELVEYIWGDKKGMRVTISYLDSPYANESPLPQDIDLIEEEPVVCRKVLMNGHLYIETSDGLFTITGQRVQ